LIHEALSGKHAWLTLANSGNDIVFNIGGVPCRFSNDDPSNPSKDAVLTANRFQMGFLEFASDGDPARFCFIIDRGLDGASEPRVEFLGFSLSGDVVIRWVSNAVRVLRDESHQPLIPPVEVAKPQVAPKLRPDDDAIAEATR